jgi:hypothetical protein
MVDSDEQTKALEEKIEGMVEKAMSKHLQPMLVQAISAATGAGPSEKTTGGGKQSSYLIGRFSLYGMMSS